MNALAEPNDDGRGSGSRRRLRNKKWIIIGAVVIAVTVVAIAATAGVVTSRRSAPATNAAEEASDAHSDTDALAQDSNGAIESGDADTVTGRDSNSFDNAYTIAGCST